MGDPWPFVGRVEETHRIWEALKDPRIASITVTGPLGIGKTELVRAVTSTAHDRGHATAWVSGLVATEVVPFGPFLAYAPPAERSYGSRLSLARRIVGELERRQQAPERLLLVVDDAQHLDAASRTVVHELMKGTAVIVVAVADSIQGLPRFRTGAERSPATCALELGPLREEDVEELLLRALEGRHESDLAARLWRASSGHPLVLHEVIQTGPVTGALARRAGGWSLVGPILAQDRAEALLAEICPLSRSERSVLEVVALAEPLEAALLERLEDGDAIVEVERRGLMEARTDGHRLTTRLAPGPVAALLGMAIPPLARRSIHRRLADALDQAGGRRREDLPRRARALLDAGSVPELDVLVMAAQRAVDLFDLPLGERLARTAVDAGGGFPAAILLGRALSDQGRGEEAEALLSRLDEKGLGDDGRSELACIRARNLFFRMHDLERADRVLRMAEQLVTSPAAHSGLASARCEQLMWSGSVGQLLEEVESRPDSPSTAGTPGDAFPWRLSLGSLARAYGGDPEDALASLAAGGEAWADATAFRWSRWWALWLSGQIREAHAIAEHHYATGATDGRWRFPASWPMMLGYSLLLRGRPRSACAYLGEAAAAGTDRGGFRHLCLALLAQAAALCGERAEADRAVAAAQEALGSTLRCHRGELLLAQACVAATKGDLVQARELGFAAAERARSLGQPPFEAIALHDLVRLGTGHEVIGRLEAVGSRMDGVLGAVLAEHARALLSSDGLALDKVAERFDEMGAGIWAAEAAVEAARSHRARGAQVDAYASGVMAASLARQCEGAMTPALAGLSEGPDALTAREREVAELAGHGLSGRQIAAFLSIGLRTVDNHLYRVYDKLGLGGRGDLTAVHHRATTFDERSLRQGGAVAPPA